MKKLSTMFLLFGVFIISACSQGTPEEQRQKRKDYANNDITKYMFYVQDPRTGLCFARSITSGNYHAYSPVVCTDKVKENLLNEQK